MIPTLGWGHFKPSQEAPRVARRGQFEPSQRGHYNLSQSEGIQTLEVLDAARESAMRNAVIAL
jgi:hypothetical protein